MLTLLAALGGQAVAQDIITKKDATEIQAKVIKVGSTEIEYRPWNNLDGPLYTIPLNEVFTIKYENGQRDVISQLTSNSGYHSSNNTLIDRPKGNKLYQGEIGTGYAVGINGAIGRYVFETVHGARINPYLFIGAGAGFSYGSFTIDSYSYSIDYDIVHVPIFVNTKGYYPITDELSVYMSVDFGAAIGCSAYAEGTAFYTTIGPGLTYGKAKGLTFAARYQYMNIHSFLFSVGFRF